MHETPLQPPATRPPSAMDEQGIPYFSHGATVSITTSDVSASSARPEERKKVRLYISGRDLPEPDSRSRATFALLYYAIETPVGGGTESGTGVPVGVDLPHGSTLTYDTEGSRPSRGLSHHETTRLKSPLVEKHAAHEKRVSSAPLPAKMRTPAAAAAAAVAERPRTARKTQSVPQGRHRHRNHHNHHRHHHHHAYPHNVAKHGSTPFTSGGEASPPPPSRVDSHHLPYSVLSKATPLPSAGILTPLLRLWARPSPSSVRAPHFALQSIAPSHPERTTCAKTGGILIRSGWQRIGATEVARKQGRDIEFARNFHVDFAPRCERVVIRVAMFDCTSAKPGKHRLIAVCDFPLTAVYAANGRRESFPLRFLPLSRRDGRRRAKVPDGALLVVAEKVCREPSKFKLDVECNRILRATSLSTSEVKRVFYTLHGILDKEEGSDTWTLLSRSGAVEMIHKKRDGGSLEYNYFSTTRMKAMPGMIATDVDEDGEMDSGEDVGMFAALGKMLGVRRRQQFFSLPGANVVLKDAGTRLKLSLYEDNGSSAGFDLIADTQFTIEELQRRKIGECSAMKMQANVVGKAQLKYVECRDNPRYFCLSLMMQSIQ